jgi:hypothetical protein
VDPRSSTGADETFHAHQPWPAALASRSLKQGKRNTPEQIIRTLRTAEHLLNQVQTFAHVFRTLKVSAPTYHSWQKLYGNMNATNI